MAVETTLALLRKIPLFSSLDPASQEKLAEQCRRRKFGAGETLFLEGEPGQTLYLILSGKVSIEKTTSDGETVPIARRGPGEFFGEMALLEDAPRSATVVTETPCLLATLDRSVLMRFLEAHPKVAWSLLQILSARLREASERLRDDRSGDALQRLAHLLCEEASAIPAAPDGARVLPALPVERLSQRLGVSREHVSRTLSQFRDQGVLQRDGRRLVVKNLPKLRTLAEP